MRKRTNQFVIVVLVSLLVAAAVLAPGRQERAAMLASEGRYEEAIALLQRQFISGLTLGSTKE